jgi:hypothetical protein
MSRHRARLRRSPSTPFLDTKAILSEFQLAYDAAQSSVEPQSGLWELVPTTLLLCEFLSADLDLDDYCEVYRKCLTHLTRVVVRFRESGATPDCDLDAAYRVCAICENAMSRVFGCLAFACAMQALDRVRDAVEMVRHLTKPLAIFLLFLTAITLYPSDAPTARQFRLDHYGRMSDAIPALLAAHPEAEENVRAWIATSIDATLRARDQGVAAIESIVQSAIHNRARECMSLQIMSALLQSVPGERIRVALPLVARFFTKVGVSERTRRLAQCWCERAPSLNDLFDFVIETPFANEMSTKIMEDALAVKDLAVVRKCLCEWPTDAFFEETLLAVGARDFAAICPPLHADSPIIEAFLTAITEPLPAALIRGVMAPVLAQHTSALEDQLALMISTVEFDAVTIREFFQTPFEFVTERLLAKLIEVLDPAFDELIQLMGQARSIEGAVRMSMLCDRYHPENSDALLEAVLIEELPDPIVGRVVDLLSKSHITQAARAKLFHACTDRIALTAFLTLLEDAGDASILANEALSEWLRLDGELVDLRNRIELYVQALRFVLGTKLAYEPSLVDTIVDSLTSVLAQCLQIPCFPLASRAVLEAWIATLSDDFPTLNFTRFAPSARACVEAFRALVSQDKPP